MGFVVLDLRKKCGFIDTEVELEIKEDNKTDLPLGFIETPEDVEAKSTTTPSPDVADGGEIVEESKGISEDEAVRKYFGLLWKRRGGKMKGRGGKMKGRGGKMKGKGEKGREDEGKGRGGKMKGSEGKRREGNIKGMEVKGRLR